jgi:hypothetical protein
VASALLIVGGIQPTIAAGVVTGSVADDPAATALLGPDWRQQELDATNALRAQAGSGAVTECGTLDLAAHGWAAYLADHQTLAHTAPDGTAEYDRMIAVGYNATRKFSGENVAYGQSAVAQVVRAWQLDPQHYTVMVDPRYVDVGFGVAQGADGYLYWVQDFGSGGTCSPAVAGTAANGTGGSGSGTATGSGAGGSAGSTGGSAGSTGGSAGSTGGSAGSTGGSAGSTGGSGPGGGLWVNLPQRATVTGAARTPLIVGPIRVGTSTVEGRLSQGAYGEVALYWTPSKCRFASQRGRRCATVHFDLETKGADGSNLYSPAVPVVTIFTCTKKSCPPVRGSRHYRPFRDYRRYPLVVSMRTAAGYSRPLIAPPCQPKRSPGTGVLATAKSVSLGFCADVRAYRRVHGVLYRTALFVQDPRFLAVSR